MVLNMHSAPMLLSTLLKCICWKIYYSLHFFFYIKKKSYFKLKSALSLSKFPFLFQMKNGKSNKIILIFQFSYKIDDTLIIQIFLMISF